jgi:hypothetical protein
MIFTVFTVIFLPLTFFTGLFGMNTREWGGGTFLPLHTIGLVSIPASFVIITLALIVAWSTRMRRVFNKVAKTIKIHLVGLRKLGGKGINWVLTSTISDKMERKRSIEEKEKRKREKREAKEAKKAASWLDEDFWEGHVLGREKDYKLPLQNRKSVGYMRKMMEAKVEGREVDGVKMWGKRKGKV